MSTFEGKNTELYATGQPVEQTTANSHHAAFKIKMASEKTSCKRETLILWVNTQLCRAMCTPQELVSLHRPWPTACVLGVHHRSHFPHGHSLARVTEHGCVTALPSEAINSDSLRTQPQCVFYLPRRLDKTGFSKTKWHTLQLFTKKHIPPFN